jgi:starch synthase
MEIIHIAAECFPMAKVGGLADVVGALPKFQDKNKRKTKVVMPFYNLAFIQKNEFKSIFEGKILLSDNNYEFRILTLKREKITRIFFVDIPELLFTEYVYSSNDLIRFLAFQIAVLEWIKSLKIKPEIIHVHDHHTGLIPFMMTQCDQFETLKNIPTIFTIHNAQYQGWFSHDKINLIPKFDVKKVGLLDWNGEINPMAVAIKCAWRITTVSPTYMEELKKSANGLESLLQHETKKCTGILNGIDVEVWNPETDEHLIKNYNKNSLLSGKKGNKTWLCKEYGLDANKPLIVFIGRFVHDKGCDLFAEVFKNYLDTLNASILVLGSGNPEIQDDLNNLNAIFKGKYQYVSGYNEPLSHIMYAGADFLLMPSRIEPCGLNQLYALRYGTIPIVCSVGGLKDTVVDYREANGFGICMPECTVEQMKNALFESIHLYEDKKKLNKIRNQIMKIDHSWSVSALEYEQLYQELKN